MDIPFDTSILSNDLMQCETEMRALNERRREIYARSLKAAEEDKACADLVSSAMLEGPLSPANQIDWPVQVNGIAFNDAAPKVLQRGEATGSWVRVTTKDNPDSPMLGLHLGDLASAVQAQLRNEDKVLHLTYVGHQAVLYVPAIQAVVIATDVEWSPLEDQEQLSELFGPPSSHVWHDRAYRDLEDDADFEIWWEREVSGPPAEGGERHAFGIAKKAWRSLPPAFLQELALIQMAVPLADTDEERQELSERLLQLGLTSHDAKVAAEAMADEIGASTEAETDSDDTAAGGT